jgi:hypothetical protein
MRIHFYYHIYFASLYTSDEIYWLIISKKYISIWDVGEIDSLSIIEMKCIISLFIIVDKFCNIFINFDYYFQLFSYVTLFII